MRRITERDMLGLKFIAEQKVVRLDVVGEYLDIRGHKTDPRSLQSISSRWVEMGYIQKERILATGPSVMWPTKFGLKLAGLAIQKGERFGKPSLANLIHDLTVSRVRLEYEKHNAIWTSERLLRVTFKDEHLPDGHAVINGLEVLVEIDITKKDNKRLLNIMRSHSRYPNIASVDYWTTFEFKNFIDLASTEINRENNNELIRTFTITKGENYE